MSAAEGAWQAALAAEHQAVFGYGVLGPHLHGAQRALAQASSAAHEDLRNATEQAMVAASVVPVAPMADYPALYPVASAASARVLAVRLEDECATAWRYLYAVAAAPRGSPGLRPGAQRALIDSAVRGTRWRQAVDPARATDAFPGIDP